MKKNTILFLVVIACFLGIFLFYPILYILRESFLPQGNFSLAYFRNILSNPATRTAMANSFWLSVATTLVTALLAIPLALLMTRFRFPGKTLLGGLLMVPMIMPPFVGAIGMRQLLARFGSINLLLLEGGLVATPIDWLGSARFWGVVIVEALHLYPIFYLNASAALANVEPALEEAALNLGSGRMSAFRRVTLPLMMPGLFAGAILVALWSFTDLGTPLIFEYRNVMAVQIFDRTTDLSDNPEGHALVVLMLIITTAIFLTSKKFFGTKGYETIGKGGTGASEKTLGPLGGFAAMAAVGGVVLIACLPHLAVVLTSIREKWFMTVLPESYTALYYVKALGHDLTLPSIKNSILLSAMSMGVDIVLGVAVAYLLARRRFRGIDLLDAAVMLPLAIPGLVLAFGYLACFAGTVLDPRINPMPLLVIAYSVRRLPYTVRTAYGGFLQISQSLEEAAINLGSSAFRTMRKVTLPLISANIIAGAILAFSFAMLEVSESLVLAVKEQYFPITKAIYQLMARIEDGPFMASALGVWSMAFLAVSLLIAGVLLGRKMGQLFRV
ncbi:MAG: iron ABC transporter permease [Deltaproteobacteria bacterium]|nr:iron ABC transporter permease [Deltaproteobacteria bacterium]